MKLDISIRWLKDLTELRKKGEIVSITVDTDYVDNHSDLVGAIEDSLWDKYVEGEDYEIVNEERFWNDVNCPTKDNSGQVVHITKERVKTTLQVLVDNGIAKDEAETVLQAIGYTLLDMELNGYF